jgi:hypothetical protein
MNPLLSPTSPRLGYALPVSVFARPPPPPRPTSIAAAGWNAHFLLLFGGLWSGVSLLVAVILTLSDRPVWDDWILDDRGLHADAQVIEVRPTHSSVNEEDVFEIVVRFQGARGKAHQASLYTHSAKTLEAAKRRDRMRVDYDPRDPSRARLTGGRAAEAGATAMVPGGLGVLGLPLFLVGLVKALRARRLYRRGIEVEARVTEIVATRSEENDRTVMEMRYAFSTPAGPAAGAWKTVEPAEAGTAIWVVYDPENPARNTPSQA